MNSLIMPNLENLIQYPLVKPKHSYYPDPSPPEQEPPILTVLAFCSIFCGIGLSAASGRAGRKPLVLPRLAGSVFVLGFVLLGIAISRWRFG